MQFEKGLPPDGTVLPVLDDSGCVSRDTGGHGTAEGDSGGELTKRVAEMERLMGYHSERVTELEEVVADLTRRVERLE